MEVAELNNVILIRTLVLEAMLTERSWYRCRSCWMKVEGTAPHLKPIFGDIGDVHAGAVNTSQVLEGVELCSPSYIIRSPSKIVQSKSRLPRNRKAVWW